jgi:signal transduction histidine kinase
VEQVRRAGLPVELVVLGAPRRLPAEVELNALRIVQEALTNSLRHSGRTRVTVTLTYGDDGLDIDVTDAGGIGHPGAVPAARDTGTGLRRAATVSPACGSGWRCSAVAWRRVRTARRASG